MSSTEARTAAGSPIPSTGLPVTVAVTMAPGRPADQTVAATLCLPPGPPPATVQVLIPGGTYSQAYWYMQGQPGGPCYVDVMTAAGYATLSVDRLGTGASSRPHSSQFTDQTHEDVIHQVIERLRDGSLGGHRFTKVILAGNSFGSTIARMVAVRHPGAVDGLILTGESSTPNLAAFAEHEASYQPASQDPRLAGRELDDGYLVLKRGGKAAWFYHTPNADPAVIERDDAAAEPDVYPSDPEYGSPSLDPQIKAPVLIMVGDHDKLMCGENATDCSSPAALLAVEQRAYGGNGRVEAVVVKDTGHVLNTHRSAPAAFAIARDWADRQVGAKPGLAH